MKKMLNTCYFWPWFLKHWLVLKSILNDVEKSWKSE